MSSDLPCARAAGRMACILRTFWETRLESSDVQSDACADDQLTEHHYTPLLTLSLASSILSVSRKPLAEEYVGGRQLSCALSSSKPVSGTFKSEWVSSMIGDSKTHRSRPLE